ncbi:class I SAM-dependent methyltransferase [Paracoccus alkanivorans]|uniref:Methyltransferase domain-containing protein n=1 Tax=Paracoccus alkanivorans TaxID=2116655 RepID=A0A3M0MGT3_9RHOB|nr:methyltransferase domain-containing protein [Paracoccus alkanivorans]RMC34850.1 methyltransferase domain-containing protein [Paracoccus alkanivorans]
MSDLPLFLGQFIRRPSEIRSVIPTGRATAREMARHVSPDMKAVAEIGAGTGTITQAILARGLPPERLDLYELNAAFCDWLRSRFPGTRVHNRPAQEMVNQRDEPFDAVISGVPTLPMPDELQAAIVGAALSVMRPGAPFVQITYGPLPPLSEAVRRRFGLRHERSRRIWANLPPARVYAFRQG